MASHILKSENIGVQLGTSASTVYTCPSNQKARILAATAANDTTTSPTFTVYHVTSGGTAGAANLLINSRPIRGNGTDLCPELRGIVLQANETIQASADTADQVNLHLSVDEIVED